MLWWKRNLGRLKMASVFQRAVRFLSLIEDNIVKNIFFRYPPECFAPALVILPSKVSQNYNEKSLMDILKDSFLWAVPKKRRSIEKRRSRRFGIPGQVYKMFVPKKDIYPCSECGHYKQAGLLCPNCYSKIKAVTTEMQEAIKKQLGIAPIDEEVVVLYEDDEKPEFFEGKRIVEIKKERPKLFCDNLMQRSTQGPATTKDIVEKKILS